MKQIRQIIEAVLQVEDEVQKTNESLTPFIAQKTAQQRTEFDIDPSKGLTKKRYAWYSNNSIFDQTHFDDTSVAGAIQVQTSTSSTDTARIRSSVAGQYRAQTLAVPGQGATIDESIISQDSEGLTSLTNGIISIGAGWHNGSSGGWDVGNTINTFLGFKFDTDSLKAVLVSDGQHKDDSPVSQKDFNIDTMDGSGDEDNPSGLQLRPQDGYIYNQLYTWYNQGALIVGVVHPDVDRFVPMHKFVVDGEPSMGRPNLPTIVILDNDGDSSSLTVDVGGMQYSRYGTGTQKQSRTTPLSRFTSGDYISTTRQTDANNSLDVEGTSGKPLIALKSKATLDDIIYRVPRITLDADQDVYILQWDEYDDSTALTNENFRNPTSTEPPETELLVDTSADAYTPTEFTFRGWTKVEGGKKDVPLGTEQTDDKIPIDATRVITSLNDGNSTDATPIKVDVNEGF